MNTVITQGLGGRLLMTQGYTPGAAPRPIRYPLRSAGSDGRMTSRGSDGRMTTRGSDGRMTTRE